jgi:hypothetical protein
MKSIQVAFAKNQNATVSLPENLLARCEATFGKTLVLATVKQAVTACWLAGSKHQSRKAQEALLKMLHVGHGAKMLDGYARLDDPGQGAQITASAVDKSGHVSVQIMPARLYNSLGVWAGGKTDAVKAQTLRYLDGVKALCVEQAGQVYRLEANEACSPFVVCGVVSFLDEMPTYSQLMHEEVLAAWSARGFTPKSNFLTSHGWSVQKLLRILVARDSIPSTLQAAKAHVAIFKALDGVLDSTPQVLREAAVSFAAGLRQDGKHSRLEEVARFLAEFQKKSLTGVSATHFTAAQLLAARWGTSIGSKAKRELAARALALWMQSEAPRWTEADLAPAKSVELPIKEASKGVDTEPLSTEGDFKIRKKSPVLSAVKPASAGLARLKSIVSSQAGLPV